MYNQTIFLNEGVIKDLIHDTKANVNTMKKADEFVEKHKDSGKLVTWREWVAVPKDKKKEILHQDVHTYQVLKLKSGFVGITHMTDKTKEGILVKSGNTYKIKLF